MNQQDLLKEELSNLYAINKQINKYFNGSDISFLAENHQLLLMEYVKFVCQSEEEASSVLDGLDINPTNTTDSIVEEITENLNKIAQQEIEDEVKSSGYRMSLNRLLGYQLANLENVKFIGKNKINFEILASLKNDFISIQQKLWN